MNETPVPAQKRAPATSSSVVTLDNFCVELSARDKRPHMIGAFHHSQRVAKILFDTPASYQTRYGNFVNQPA